MVYPPNSLERTSLEAASRGGSPTSLSFPLEQKKFCTATALAFIKSPKPLSRSKKDKMGVEKIRRFVV
jgi:hypothetical protein